MDVNEPPKNGNATKKGCKPGFSGNIPGQNTLFTQHETCPKARVANNMIDSCRGHHCKSGSPRIFQPTNSRPGRRIDFKMAVKLSERAAEEVKRFQQEHNFGDDMVLRIGIAAGGCSGFSYTLNFDDNFDDKADTKYECHGVAVVVDKKSALYLDGTTVDWFESLEKQGFTFENPNATKSCGCGSSFQA